MFLSSVKYQHRVLALLSLLSIVTYLDRVCIAVAGPRMQDSLHISPQAWGWVTSVFFFSYTAFEIPTGIMGDRIGPRRVLTRIVLWWSLFTSLTGAISGYFVLLVVRFLFGIGEAGAYPNMNIVLARWIPAAKRGRAWGMIFMTTQIGGAISPLLVVPIQMRFGWRASFYVFGFLGVLWGALWYWWFRDTPAGKPGITNAELVEIGEPPHLGPAESGHGVQWGLALRSGPLWRISIIGGCYLYTMAFFASWLQTYLVRGRGYTEGALVLSSLPYILGAAAAGLGGIVSDWLVRRMGLRNGRRSLGVFGLGTAAVFMTLSVLTPNNLWALVFLSISYTGILLQQPNLCAVVLDTARKNAGGVFAFLNTVSNAGSALSTVVFGYMVAYFGNYTAPFVPMILALILGTVLWLGVDPTQQLFADDPSPSPAVQLSEGISA
jgi:MFS transporter, ACS family, glucarate transporter